MTPPQKTINISVNLKPEPWPMLTRTMIETWLKEAAEDRIISNTSKMWRDRTVVVLTELERQVSGLMHQATSHPLSLVVSRDYADQRARLATESSDKAHKMLRLAHKEVRLIHMQMDLVDAKLRAEHGLSLLEFITSAPFEEPENDKLITHIRDIF